VDDELIVSIGHVGMRVGEMIGRRGDGFQKRRSNILRRRRGRWRLWKGRGGGGGSLSTGDLSIGLSRRCWDNVLALL
jgi:hypothetical protein